VVQAVGKDRDGHAVPLGINAAIKERPRLLGVIGVFLGLTPFWLGMFISHLASWVKGFTFEP
jgi:hypothetical protein